MVPQFQCYVGCVAGYAGLLIVIKLLQTPNSPIAAGSSGGRKTSNRIILACHGYTQSNTEVRRNDQKSVLLVLLTYS